MRTFILRLVWDASDFSMSLSWLTVSEVAASREMYLESGAVSLTQ